MSSAPSVSLPSMNPSRSSRRTRRSSASNPERYRSGSYRSSGSWLSGRWGGALDFVDVRAPGDRLVEVVPDLDDLLRRWFRHQLDVGRFVVLEDEGRHAENADPLA